ncbi:MAG: sensor histidine kinase [Chloroherpetonaceae bacterium]|nr:sensor histidine kinase [Chloroherpetonaceae bacterium]
MKDFFPKISRTFPPFFSLRFVLLFFVFPHYAFAFQDTLECHRELGHIKLNTHSLRYYEDVTDSLSLDSLIRHELNGELHFSPSPSTNFGYTQSAYWGKIVLKNSTNESLSYFLVSKDQYSKTIDFYSIPSTSNGIYSEHHTGLYFPFDTRKGFLREFVFQTSLDAHEVKTIYVRTTSFRQTILDLHLYSPADFERRNRVEFYLFGLYFGAAFSLILYNFFLYLSLRDRNFIIYVLFNLPYVTAVWLHNGFGYEILPESIAFFSRRYLMYSLYFFSLIFAIAFIRDFLNLKKFLPSFYKATFIFIYLFIILSLLSFVLPQPLLSKAINYTTLPTAIFAIVIGVLRMKQGDKTALYFFIGWSVFITGGILFQLEGLNLVPSNFFSSYAYQIGSGLEMILLSLALGDRINTLRLEKEAAEKDAIEAELFRLRNIELASALQESDRLKKIAEEANKQKTELFAIAAHDLKNPLTSIGGFSSLILEESDIEKIKMMAGRIQSSSRRMVNLISELLESSAYEIGSITLKKESFHLSPILEAVANQNSALAELKFQRIQLTCDSKLMLVADKARLFETVDNLISNAIKYSFEHTTIELSVMPFSLTKNHPMHSSVSHPSGILISVRDEGQGLSESDLEKVFKRFQKLSSKPTGNESSTGLGLSIVKDIVTLHGGAAWVESLGKNKGCTFYLFFPLP